MGSQVILVTDADCHAKDAVEVAARNVGGRCISLSGCRHPDDDRFTPEEIEELVRSAEHDPVIVMADDEGFVGEGYGESVIRHLAAAEGIEILGAVAVASNTAEVRPVAVSVSSYAGWRCDRRQRWTKPDTPPVKERSVATPQSSWANSVYT